VGVPSVGKADSSLLASAIRRAIISGGSAPMKPCHRCALAADPNMTRSRLRVMTVASCVSLGRLKQARGWIEAWMIHLDPADVFDAQWLAIDSRHAELALTLFSRAETVVLSDSGCMLLLAEKTILLAETLRMPKQHFSVWSTHLSLLEEAVRLLTAIRPNSDASLDQVKVALLKRARHLLGEQGHAPLG